MAPTLVDLARSAPNIAPRGITAPTCVISCMARGDTTGCASIIDYSCLCASDYYTTSVMTCWNVNCNSTEYAKGLTYTASSCAVYGVTLVPATSTGVDASVATVLTIPPVIYSRAVWNIQAVMSSICSLVLLAAIILGFMSCRAQARRQAMTQGHWTGLPSHMDTKNGARTRSRHGRSGAPHLDSFGHLTTMDLTRTVDRDLAYPIRSVNRDPTMPRFTNRLPPAAQDMWGEEAHEMHDLEGGDGSWRTGMGRASGSHGSDDDEVKTPYGGNSVLGHEDEDEDGDTDKDKSALPDPQPADVLSSVGLAGHSLADMDEADAERELSLVGHIGTVPMPPTPTTMGTMRGNGSEFGGSTTHLNRP